MNTNFDNGLIAQPLCITVRYCASAVPAEGTQSLIGLIKVFRETESPILRNEAVSELVSKVPLPASLSSEPSVPESAIEVAVIVALFVIVLPDISFDAIALKLVNEYLPDISALVLLRTIEPWLEVIVLLADNTVFPPLPFNFIVPLPEKEVAVSEAETFIVPLFSILIFNVVSVATVKFFPVPTMYFPSPVIFSSNAVASVMVSEPVSDTVTCALLSIEIDFTVISSEITGAGFPEFIITSSVEVGTAVGGSQFSFFSHFEPSVTSEPFQTICSASTTAQPVGVPVLCFA